LQITGPSTTRQATTSPSGPKFWHHPQIPSTSNWLLQRLLCPQHLSRIS
jgi:hypothetical protein